MAKDIGMEKNMLEFRTRNLQSIMLLVMVLITLFMSNIHIKWKSRVCTMKQTKISLHFLLMSAWLDLLKLLLFLL